MGRTSPRENPKKKIAMTSRGRRAARCDYYKALKALDLSRACGEVGDEDYYEARKLLNQALRERLEEIALRASQLGTLGLASPKAHDGGDGYATIGASSEEEAEQPNRLGVRIHTGRENTLTASKEAPAKGVAVQATPVEDTPAIERVISLSDLEARLNNVEAAIAVLGATARAQAKTGAQKGSGDRLDAVVTRLEAMFPEATTRHSVAPATKKSVAAETREQEKWTPSSEAKLALKHGEVQDFKGSGEPRWVVCTVPKCKNPLGHSGEGRSMAGHTFHITSTHRLTE